MPASLAKKSLVGTTIQKDTDIPRDLVGDEHHSKHSGGKVYVATTVAKGCFLGAEVTDACDEKGLTKAYGTYKEETMQLNPNHRPGSINLDGWQAGNKAWKNLFKGIAIIACFLHGFLKTRDRALKKMNTVFLELSDKVWDCYRAENKKALAKKSGGYENGQRTTCPIPR